MCACSLQGGLMCSLQETGDVCVFMRNVHEGRRCVRVHCKDEEEGGAWGGRRRRCVFAHHKAELCNVMCAS